MKTTVMLICALTGLLWTMGCENKTSEIKPEATEPVAEQAATEEGVAAAPGAAAMAEQEPAVPSVPETMEVAVGKPAPEFALVDEAGKEHKLSDYKGKIVVLEWTSPACPYVKRHYKEKTMATSLEQAGGAEKVAWLAVDSSHSVEAEATKTWKGEEGFGYPVLLDAEGKVGKMYQAKTTPHLFVIDDQGVVRYSGAIDDNERGDKTEGITNYVTTAIKSLQEGQPVAVAETKPYGCSVKFGS